MQDAQKKEFTLRISQANRTELVVIILEMAVAYIKDAMDAPQEEEYQLAIKRAENCINELKHSLDFQYELAGMLLHLYIHVCKLLVRASVSGKKERLEEAETILKKLRDAFAEVAKQDDSGPLLQNAQTVYAGYTYGKNDLNVNLDGESTGRGFLA